MSFFFFHQEFSFLLHTRQPPRSRDSTGKHHAPNTSILPSPSLACLPRAAAPSTKNMMITHNRLHFPTESTMRKTKPGLSFSPTGEGACYLPVFSPDFFGIFWSKTQHVCARGFSSASGSLLGEQPRLTYQRSVSRCLFSCSTIQRLAGATRGARVAPGYVVTYLSLG